MAVRDLKTDPNRPDLIAPCGINCRLCRAYAREKNPCPGCRSTDNRFKAPTCIACKIKNCDQLMPAGLQFCNECSSFPCYLMRRLEKRYTTRYKTSPFSNLHSINEIGMDRFIDSENIKWACPQCGSMLCMHEPECLACGYAWH